MGRQTYYMHKAFNAPLDETWWGFLLPDIPCASCVPAVTAPGVAIEAAAEAHCPVCVGEGVVQPRVAPPGWPLDEVPKWARGDADYGWQMWQTTSEGGPISPVCESPEALAYWLADNNAPRFGFESASYDAWLRVIQGAGWAPSLVVQARRGGQGNR